MDHCLVAFFCPLILMSERMKEYALYCFTDTVGIIFGIVIISCILLLYGRKNAE